ncbi:hypothetical protein [Polaribacter sp. R77954]|uniref:hypothetical protein n=1 Tax=Polaribacter sp. R77954 TaxID=3093870 RepID=UPI0037CA4955
MIFKKRIIFITFLFFCFGCEEKGNEIVCTTEYVYGLHVTLLDASNSLPITDDVTVVIKDDNYEEVLQIIESNNSFFGAGERSGTYTITIISNSYITFVSEPITVTRNICHVIPVSKTIALTPSI